MEYMTMWKRLLPQAMLMVLLIPGWSDAEFYRYEDRNGTIHFVDDIAKVPKEYRKKKQVRKDKYDNLPEEDRVLMRENDLQEHEASRIRDEERSARNKRKRDEQDRHLARERLLKELTTKVMITGNQVFVPVTLANGSVETEALLLLDTGATSSVITPEVAERLNIEQFDTINIGVVGGKVLRARRTSLSHMMVGPVKRANQQVVIVRRGAGTGGDGLLGMSFLRGLKYTIDFEKSVINWIP